MHTLVVEPEEPFNPLDKRNLAESVAVALLRKPVGKLPPEPFTGAGIYAIYYTGTHPLYVGKAVPKGARKGGAERCAPGRDVAEIEAEVRAHFENE